MSSGLTRPAAVSLTRRAALGLAGGVMLTGMAPANLKALESSFGGHLGFALLDTQTRTLVGHREDERFAMCSTFKLPLAALVLAAAERGELSLDTKLAITKADLVPHHPVTGPSVGQSLSIAALAEAAQTTSDNVAANLLVARLGGPMGVTRRLRALGDEVTRLDRMEPAMNNVVPPDPRDTTTPRAMVKTLETLLLGDALAPASQARLIGWMVDTKTGLNRLRAGVPSGWKAGDKTGTGYGPGRPTRVNDIAIIWPPKRAPLIVAAFSESARPTDGVPPEQERLLADALTIALDRVGSI